MRPFAACVAPYALDEFWRHPLVTWSGLLGAPSQDWEWHISAISVRTRQAEFRPSNGTG